MSWANGDGTVTHNLIYNHFPGYSLKHRLTPEDPVFETLTHLVGVSRILLTLKVQHCNFLTEALEIENLVEEKKDDEDSTPQHPQTRYTCSIPFLNAQCCSGFTAHKQITR